MLTEYLDAPKFPSAIRSGVRRIQLILKFGLDDAPSSACMHQLSSGKRSIQEMSRLELLDTPPRPKKSRCGASDRRRSSSSSVRMLMLTDEELHGRSG